jgi:hypothetical protein
MGSGPRPWCRFFSDVRQGGPDATFFGTAAGLIRFVRVRHARRAAASDYRMRALLIVGILLLVLGIASLFVSIPRNNEKHGVQIGGAEVGVETRSSERIPLPASVAIIIGGIVLSVVGGRAGSSSN